MFWFTQSLHGPLVHLSLPVSLLMYHRIVLVLDSLFYLLFSSAKSQFIKQAEEC